MNTFTFSDANATPLAQVDQNWRGDTSNVASIDFQKVSQEALQEQIKINREKIDRLCEELDVLREEEYRLHMQLESDLSPEIMMRIDLIKSGAIKTEFNSMVEIIRLLRQKKGWSLTMAKKYYDLNLKG